MKKHLPFIILFIILGMAVLLSGCNKEPKTVGKKIVSAQGSSGLQIDIEGPQSIEGDIPQPQGIQFPIKMILTGPANGAARIGVTHPPLVDGCDIVKSLPMYIEFDSSGHAEAEGTVLFASDVECTYGFEVTAAAQFKSDPRHYELYEPTDKANASVTFRRKVDSDSPQMVRYTARKTCEGYAEEELQNSNIYIDSFIWSPASGKNLEDKKYEITGSFSIKHLGFNLRCTMEYDNGNWTLLQLEIPGLEQARKSGDF